MCGGGECANRSGGILSPDPHLSPPALFLTLLPAPMEPLYCTHPHSHEVLTKEALPDPHHPDPHPLIPLYISISHASKLSVYVGLSSGGGGMRAWNILLLLMLRTGDQTMQGVGGLSVHTSPGPGPPLATGTTQGTTVSPLGPLTTLSGR